MWNWKQFPPKGWLIIAVLFLLMGALACGSAAAPQAEQPVEPAAPAVAVPTTAPQAAAVPVVAEVKVHPGKLTVMLGDFGNERFHGTFPGFGATQSYGRTFHAFLISDNPEKELVPGLASEWGLSADGRTWTFTIREGVKFHDGSDLTAEDVIWTIRERVGPEAFEWTTSGWIKRSKLMDRVELAGPDTVKMITKEPFTFQEAAVMFSEAGPNYFPILPKRPELHDVDVEAAYDANPIGAGPMSLAEHVQAYVMKFERFDDFYYQPKNGLPVDKRVNFQSMDIFLVPEVATRVAAIRAGDADIAPASSDSRKQVEAGGGRMMFGPEGSYIDIRWVGCYGPELPCFDKRVRQAFSYAIDKEVIREKLFGPETFQVKGWQWVTPSTFGYTPGLDAFPFDPDKARQLLADAGYPGGEGFGKLFVHTTPSETVPLQVEMVQLGIEYWKRELGVDVEMRVTDGATLSKLERARDIDGDIRWRDNEARTDITQYISQSYSDPTHYQAATRDPEIIDLALETLRIGRDPAKREEAYQKFLLRVREESHGFGFGYVNVPWAVGPRVLTWELWPLSTHLHSLHTITLK